jgi:hypothetical protein
MADERANFKTKNNKPTPIVSLFHLISEWIKHNFSFPVAELCRFCIRELPGLFLLVHLKTFLGSHMNFKT